MLFNTAESNPAKVAYTKLYSKLVPESGNCSTLEGELIRAISNIFWEYQECGILSNHTGACNFIRKYLNMDPRTKQDLEDIYHYVKVGYIPNVNITEQLDRLTHKITQFVDSKNDDTYIMGDYDFNLYQEADELDIDDDYIDPSEPLFYLAMPPSILNDNMDGDIVVPGHTYQKTDARSISATCFIIDKGESVWMKNRCMYPVFKNENIDTHADYVFISPSPKTIGAKPVKISGRYFIDNINRVWYGDANTNFYYEEQYLEKIITESTTRT